MAENWTMRQKLADRKMEVQKKNKEIVKLTHMKEWAQLADEQLFGLQKEYQNKLKEERLISSKRVEKERKACDQKMTRMKTMCTTEIDNISTKWLKVVTDETKACNEKIKLITKACNKKIKP